MYWLVYRSGTKPLKTGGIVGDDYHRTSIVAALSGGDYCPEPPTDRPVIYAMAANHILNLVV